MEGKKVTETVAHFVTDFNFNSIPMTVLDNLKTHILDTIGNMLGGSVFEASKMAARAMLELGGNPEAILVGHGAKLPCTSAALVNGVSAHSLELDDGHSAALVHPGATVLPAALALGERTKASGKDILESTLLGYEVALRVGMAVFPWHRRRGFHPTGTCGTLGAAVAAGKILNLDSDEMASCIGLAGTQAASLREGHGPEALMMKRFHAGKASQNGVIAALLAKQSFTAPHTILEGENGFCKVLAGESDLTKITNNLGEEFVIDGCYIKPYAACRHAHAPIDSLLRLRKEHQFSPKDVDSITLRIYKEGSYFATKKPQSHLDGQFSIPYCLSVALHDGTVLLEQFSEKKIHDPNLIELADRIDVVFDPEMDKEFVETKKRAHSLEIRLKNGTQILARTPYPKGEPQNPLTLGEVNQKAKSLAATAITEEHIDQLLRVVERLETVSEIRQLTRLLSGEPDVGSSAGNP